MYSLDIIISCNNPTRLLMLLKDEIPKQVGGRLIGSGFYGNHSIDLQLEYEYEDEVRGAKLYIENECRRLGYKCETHIFMDYEEIEE